MTGGGGLPLLGLEVELLVLLLELPSDPLPFEPEPPSKACRAAAIRDERGERGGTAAPVPVLLLGSRRNAGGALGEILGLLGAVMVAVDTDVGGDNNDEADDDDAGGVVVAAGDGVVVAGVGEYIEGDDAAGDAGIESLEIDAEPGARVGVVSDDVEVEGDLGTRVLFTIGISTTGIDGSSDVVLVGLAIKTGSSGAFGVGASTVVSTSGRDSGMGEGEDDRSKGGRETDDVGISSIPRAWVGSDALGDGIGDDVDNGSSDDSFSGARVTYSSSSGTTCTYSPVDSSGIGSSPGSVRPTTSDKPDFPEDDGTGVCRSGILSK